jgi:hypothetical protein
MLLRRGREFSPRASLKRVAASAILLLALAVAGSLAPRWIAFAQARPSFEVASIKPGDPNDQRFGFLLYPGGRLNVSNVTLRNLVGYAYDVRDHQIPGGPSWLDADKYAMETTPDRTITVPPGPPSPDKHAPLPRLLDTRLHTSRNIVVTVSNGTLRRTDSTG